MLNLSQILNLNCSQLVINGVPYSPPRQVFYGNGSNGFSVMSGSWNNQGTVYTFSLVPNQSYIMSVNFIVYTDVFEATGAMYPNFYNSITTYTPATYQASRPVAQIGNPNTFNTSGTSQFVFNDWVSFTADSNGQLFLEFNLGHNVSFWTGNYYWSLFANILSP